MGPIISLNIIFHVEQNSCITAESTRKQDMDSKLAVKSFKNFGGKSNLINLMKLISRICMLKKCAHKKHRSFLTLPDKNCR